MLPLALLLMKIRENIQSYVSKNAVKKNTLNYYHLKREKGKSHYVVIRDLNIFMYDHTIHRGKNIFIIVVYKLFVQKKY